MPHLDDDNHHDFNDHDNDPDVEHNDDGYTLEHSLMSKSYSNS